MRFLRRYKFVWLFLALLVFCSVMVIRQIEQNQSRHVELREAFILLYSKGYTGKAQHLYDRLLRDLENESNRTLFDDFQRTLQLVDPAASHPESLIWRYHWTVSNELEKRSESTLTHALKLSEEQ
ncbi:MAG: hypothetical protein JWR26_4017 [Pedosphaera sp.]|nr:hypothetical protein [Pedosphaera sp.]